MIKTLSKFTKENKLTKELNLESENDTKNRIFS